MAEDSQIINNVPQTNAAVSGASSSPWDEDVPVPPTPAKTGSTVIGSLEPKKIADENPVPFNVPENIEEKVAQKVPAEKYLTPKTEPQVEPAPQPLEQPVALTPAPAPASIPTPVPTPPSPTASIFEPDDSDFVMGTQPLPALQPTVASPLPTVKKPGFIQRLFARKPKVSPDLNNAQEAAINQPVAIPNSIPVAKTAKPKLSFLQNQKLIAVLGVIAFLTFIVCLTELGLISIGAEKIYGAIGIERFWGGLSANPENALAKAAQEMQKHPSFKVKGVMTLSVDGSIESSITSPLLSLIEQKNSLAKNDSNISESIPALKTVAKSSDIYDLYDSTNSDLSSTSSSGTDTTDGTVSDGSLGTSSDTSGADTTDTTDTTDADSSLDSVATTDSEISNIQEIKSSVSVKTSKEGMSADLIVENASGSSNVNLMLNNGKLLVKSDALKFAQNANPDKWLSFALNQVKDRLVQTDIFAASSDSGFSVKGKREGNEKVGNVRCYKYKIDSMEIGNALSDIGITGDMIQNISGSIWIGISDKMIRKVDLKIITPVSSSVSSISVNLEFSEFDIDNKLSFPDEAEIIEPTVLTGATETTTASSSSSDTVSTTAPAGNDAKRKTDVGAILDALKNYKNATGSYPMSKTLLKINATGNMIEQVLVPKYLTVLPTDPTEGWYYAYKSNEGKNCSISARLENTADPEGQLIGGVLLYLKYNNN